MTLLEEFHLYCQRFTENNIFSYEDGGYTNALGDTDINDKDWDNTEELREAFEKFLELNFPDDLYIDTDFHNKEIKIYKLHRVIK